MNPSSRLRMAINRLQREPDVYLGDLADELQCTALVAEGYRRQALEHIAARHLDLRCVAVPRLLDPRVVAIDLKGGDQLRRNSARVWSLYSATDDQVRPLDPSEQQLVAAAYLAGQRAK